MAAENTTGISTAVQGSSTMPEEDNANTSTTEPHYDNRVFTADDIGVTLDYPSQEHEERINEASSEHGTESSSVSTRSRTNQSRRPTRRQKSLRDFICTKKWIAQFVSGLFTGAIFFTIGVLFVTLFDQLPEYIGVLFILVSIPPCCVAFHKLRVSRETFRIQRQIDNRRAIIRQMVEEGRENRAFRSNDLPQSDLPPSYNNLEFIVTSETPVDHGNWRSEERNVSSTSTTDIELPSYRDALVLKKVKTEDTIFPHSGQHPEQRRGSDEAISNG